MKERRSLPDCCGLVQMMKVLRLTCKPSNGSESSVTGLQLSGDGQDGLRLESESMGGRKTESHKLKPDVFVECALRLVNCKNQS